MKHIAIFTSGSGTNAQNIVEYFKDYSDIKVQLILANKPDAYVLERAKKLNVSSFVFNRTDFYESEVVLKVLEENSIDFIVLAGFLWLIPQNLIQKYSNKIVNIHPALLPKYGGKGMYGSKVHKAVYTSGDAETGISIHYVNEKYDEGAIIFQAKTKIETSDNPDSIAQKVHVLEYEHFPRVIEECLMKLD